MQTVIDIDDKLYERITVEKEYYLEDGEDLCSAIENGVPLPKGATNGDVIMALFPNAKIEHGLYGISGTPLICLNLGTKCDVHEMSFVEDWWNAPYKAESEEEE